MLWQIEGMPLENYKRGKEGVININVSKRSLWLLCREVTAGRQARNRGDNWAATATGKGPKQW